MKIVDITLYSIIYRNTSSVPYRILFFRSHLSRNVGDGKFLGNIRSSQIKSIAKAIVVNFFDQVTADFDRNKSLVMAVTNVKSKTYRNKVAGYVTTLYRQIQENKIQTLEELE